MKTYLVFLKNGEILERQFTSSTFSIIKFINYTHYKKYDNFIVLYNGDNEDNITNFIFTKDKYKGDVAVVKHENDHLKSLSIKNYNNILKKTKIESNELYYSSEDDEEHDYSNIT